MPSLLINADDFGLTPGVNRAIAELHDAGCLRSTTLMATGSAFDDAVALALARPLLGVGCHIVLTDGLPVLPPAEIPSLLGEDGIHFRPTLGVFVRDLMLGRLNELEIEREATAQMRKLQTAGIRVTHFDSHKHAHLFPAIVRPLARAAHACGVPALRNPFEPAWSIAVGGSLIRKLQLRALQRLHDPFFAQFDSLATPDGTLGVSATGNLDATSLQHLLHNMPEGVWELVCHPGYNDADLDRITTRLRTHRQVEYAALLQQIPLALRINPELRLISYTGILPSANEAL
ncbi:MAG: ChbG/HpnK family deacetylase [Acidobacteriaceae bacterium]|nr:ChbG/HpnK family deacetylase [Acidobacteriaceae bacterium]